MAQVAEKLLFAVLLLLVPCSDGFRSSRRYGGSYRFGTLHTILAKQPWRSPQIQSRFKASFLCTLIHHLLAQSMYVIKNVLEMFWHGSKPITGYDHTFTRLGTSWVWAHMRNLVWPGRGNCTFLCNLFFLMFCTQIWSWNLGYRVVNKLRIIDTERCVVFYINTIYPCI